MNTIEPSSILEHQLLLQLGDRIKRLRKDQGLGTVEMAARAGITRNTLRSVESGDPAPSLGTYLRVMSILGISGDLALLASDALHPAPAGSAGARSRHAAPVVQLRVTADQAKHQLQDLQSLALHEKALLLAKADPALVQQAQDTLQSWLAKGNARSAVLWREWAGILEARAWSKVLGRTRHAQQLRQTSPLVTILPEEVRQDILQQVISLKQGIELGAAPSTPDSGAMAKDPQ